MGLLIDGQWHDQWYDTKTTSGKFVRSEAQFRNWITPDGSPGPTGVGGFRAEPNRYHLYIGHACPWAHRTLIFRLLKGLEQMISISIVHWYMGDQGWTFARDEHVIPDPLIGADYLHQIYSAAQPNYSGRATIPILWDKTQGTIVNNESSEIIRMLNSSFDGLGIRAGDYYPSGLRDEIDMLNARIYETVNNGVYRAGFATTQEAYDEAVFALFDTLDWLELRLNAGDGEYLCGNTLTEADWRLFTTLVRFDAVYHYHFKCNLRRIRDYPGLYAYLRRLYEMPGIAATLHMDHVKKHYFGSHASINPTGIVPRGPVDPL